MGKSRAERSQQFGTPPEEPKRTRFSRPAVIAAPATPRSVHRHGDLSTAPIETISALAEQLWPTPVSRRISRDRGLRKLAVHLSQYPGGTWQQRWEASELHTAPISAGDAGGENDTQRAQFTLAVQALFMLRVVQPTVASFRRTRFVRYATEFIAAERDPALDRYVAAVETTEFKDTFTRAAVLEVCAALTTQGIAFADLTPEAFLHFSVQIRQRTSRSGAHEEKYVGHLAWQVLHSIGQFPAAAPTTLRAALRAPQLSTTEMVDRCQVADPAIQQLFIDYLDRRCAEVEYTSLVLQAHNLVRVFWKAIETINPDQRTLELSEEHYRQWRATLAFSVDGTPRQDQMTVIVTVRAFYFDIQAWAVHEPERWAQWSVPCPVPRSELRNVAKHKRRVRERMHNTIRILQPLLPALVAHVEERADHWRALLHRGALVGHDETFTVGEQSFTRVFSREDARLVDTGQTPNVHIRDPRSGRTVDVARQEDAAFWTWATVEALRLSGLRVEELTELSHLSVRQYRRPNGEMIALLVVAPSKTDRERVIPMSPELFHVTASVIRRITAGRKSVPLATRYDDYDRTTSDPQPFLFQRRIGQRLEVMTTNAIGVRLRHVCEDLADTDARFAGIHFRPHDFRRLFATDLVNNGLPIHIGAALLGHLNLDTTRGYVAVFDEDVVRHYQAHLQRRRAIRPDDEYKPVTDREWSEFDEHFDKRKVELGGCGRPYATPCTHEHACIRCPMLRVDPNMITRLDDIETDLHQRRQRAQTEGWLGEIEGIDLTLNFLTSKREQARRLARTTAQLGIPRYRAAADPIEPAPAQNGKAEPR